MVENNYTKLVSVRIPKELLERIETNRRRYGTWRESVSSVIVRALDVYFKCDMPTTQSESKGLIGREAE